VPLGSDQLTQVLDLSMRSRGSRGLVERHGLSLPCRAPGTPPFRSATRTGPQVWPRDATLVAVAAGPCAACTESWSVLYCEGALNDGSEAVATQYVTVPGVPSRCRPVSVAVQARPPNKIVLELVAMVKQ
jgi:hypothetical protein